MVPGLLKYFLPLLCLTAGIGSYAQTISGTVADRATKQPLSGATVNIGKTKTLTNAMGAFEITCNGYNDSLNVSYFGYRKFSALLIKGNVVLHIELEPSTILLKQVNIHSDRGSDFKKDSISNRVAYSKSLTIPALK